MGVGTKGGQNFVGPTYYDWNWGVPSSSVDLHRYSSRCRRNLQGIRGFVPIPYRGRLPNPHPVESKPFPEGFGRGWGPPRKNEVTPPREWATRGVSVLRRGTRRVVPVLREPVELARFL